MQLVTASNINEARKQIQKLKKKPDEKTALLSQDDEFNRKALEIKGLNMLIINESFAQKDYMKQRASGLNEILAKICAEKNIVVGVQIDEIIKKEDVEKAKSLARLKQNIMLCKKAGTRLVFVGDIKDRLALQSVLLVLGASTSQAKKAAGESFFK